MCPETPISLNYGIFLNSGILESLSGMWFKVGCSWDWGGLAGVWAVGFEVAGREAVWSLGLTNGQKWPGCKI